MKTSYVLDDNVPVRIYRLQQKHHCNAVSVNEEGFTHMCMGRREDEDSVYFLLNSDMQLDLL